jgi:hypothetical protein
MADFFSVDDVHLGRRTARIRVSCFNLFDSKRYHLRGRYDLEKTNPRKFHIHDW